MSAYESPDRCCDLVMKGGITSGILYPPAICRIAERFHLVGIGGTSAGAIAACTAAAAEYRRRATGSGEGYERLEKLPEDLGEEGRLLGLFRPDKSTRREHALLLGALGDRGWLGRFWLGTRFALAGLSYKRRLARLIDNGFGLCSGMANGNPPPARSIAPITPWLAATIDEIAGKADGSPLTFGDLRQAPRPEALTALGGTAHSIDLRAVTTCLSFGRPLELPFDGTGKIFAFDEEEWRRLFPEYVVDYLVAAARQIDAPSFQGTGKLPLPVGDAMPVVVAARMSLAFPILFTAVPLYAMDWEAGKGTLRKVWFSDGGITSNLPIQQFDALFPRWPTLAINLQYTDDEGRPARPGIDLEQLIYMIARREDGTRDLWNPFDEHGSASGNLLGFGGAIFRSAQVWHDNSFLKLPGYRDRVIEIWLKKEEGGLNLEMPRQTIESLIQRGSAAGEMLRDRFAKTPAEDPLSWDGHRWVRLRSAMAGLTEYLREFKRGADHASEHERPLAEQHAAAKKAIEDLLEYLGENQHDDPTRPFHGGPSPPVVIGSRARMS